MSAIGLGGNTFGNGADEAQTARIIHHALDVGVNFIDTADVYSRGVSEQYVQGRGRPAPGGGHRYQGARADGRPAQRRRAVPEAHHGWDRGPLRRLATDYVD